MAGEGWNRNAAEDEFEAPHSESVNVREFMSDLFKDAGAPIYINVAVSIVVLATIAERAVALYILYRIDSDAFVKFLVKLVKSGEHEKALKACATNNKPISRVCRAGLSKAKEGAVEISMAMDEELMRVSPLLEKRTASLWALANIATLIGLFGTISGLIRCFKALSAVSPELKASFLSRGIAEAMNNTAIGLGIAIVCMMGHLVLSGAVKKRQAELDSSAMTFENFLVLRSKGETAK